MTTSGRLAEGGRVHTTPSAARAVAWPAVWTIAFSSVFVWRASTTVGGRRTFTLFDDALISMRYGDNLAHGHGLVWNTGHAGVEGYTNLLWTLWLAVLHLTPIPRADMGLAVSVSGVALLVANLVVIAKLCDALAPGDATTRRVALVLTATSYSLLFWTLRGTEVGLVTLVVSASALLAVRAVRGEPRAVAWLAGAAAIGVLTRTDVAIPLAALLAAMLVAHPRTARRAAAVTAATVAIVIGAHTAARLYWYGHAVPNTYTLKVDGIALGERLHRGAAVTALLVTVEVVLPVALAVYALVRLDALRRELAIVVAPLAGCALYTIYVGGDAWEFMRTPDRFLTPGLPLLFTATGAAVAALTRAGARRMAQSSLVLAANAAVAALIAWIEPFPHALLQLGPVSTGNYTRPLLAVALLLVTTAVVVQRFVAAAPSRAAGWGVAMAVLLCIASTAPAYWNWRRSGGDLVDLDKIDVAYAGVIRAATTPRATIAVVTAGSVPYYSGRPAIDLLGKSDIVIARTPPHDIPLMPGHMKWDYAYSIGVLRPDVVIGLWLPTAEEYNAIIAAGYLRVDHASALIFVRADTTEVDIVQLRTGIAAVVGS